MENSPETAGLSRPSGLLAKIKKFQAAFKTKVVDNPLLKWYRRGLYAVTFIWAAFLLNQSAAYYEASRLGEKAFHAGNLAEAQRQFELAYNECAKFGSDWKADQRSARAMNNLAEVYRAEGKYKQAEPLYRDAANTAAKKFAEARPEPAVALANLAMLLREEGQYAEADQTYERVLKLWNEKIKQNDSTQLASILNGQAKLRRDQGRYEEAEKLYLQALGISEGRLGKQDVGNAYILGNLGALYRDMGKTAQAEYFYKRALALDMAEHGEMHPDTAIDLNSLAGLYREEGRLDAADSFYKKAYAVRLKTLGADHPLTAKTLIGMGDLARRKKEYEQGEKDFNQALAIQSKALPAVHPDVAQCLDTQGMCLLSEGKTGPAEQCFQKALTMRRSLLPADHPDIAISEVNLALARRLNNKNNSQEKTEVQDSLEKLAARLGSKHPLYINEAQLAQAVLPTSK